MFVEGAGVLLPFLNGVADLARGEAREGYWPGEEPHVRRLSTGLQGESKSWEEVIT